MWKMGQPISVRHALLVGGVELADQIALPDRPVHAEGVVGDVRGQCTVGAVDVGVGPACTIVASSTAGSVRASTRPTGLIASAGGTKMVISPAFLGEEVVGDHARRWAGRRHALCRQRGSEISPRAPWNHGPEFVEAHRLG